MERSHERRFGSPAHVDAQRGLGALLATARGAPAHDSLTQRLCALTKKVDPGRLKAPPSVAPSLGSAQQKVCWRQAPPLLVHRLSGGIRWMFLLNGPAVSMSTSARSSPAASSPVPMARCTKS